MEQKTLSIKTHTGEYADVFFKLEKYSENNNTAIIMYCKPKGEECISDFLTVNLSEKLSEDMAYIDINNIGKRIVPWLEENKLAIPVGKTKRSGFCDYPLVLLDLNRIKKHCVENDEKELSEKRNNIMKTYKIHDFKGEEVIVAPKLELYSVYDFMGTEMNGIAIQLYTVKSEENPVIDEPYSTLTVSFGEYIGMKNVAYIDTNNCPFALELLKYGFAQDTGLTKKSGFCTYPLWVFNEEFLNEIGSENYKIYSDEYDKYMSSYCGCSDDEDSNDCDDEA